MMTHMAASGTAVAGRFTAPPGGRRIITVAAAAVLLGVIAEAWGATAPDVADWAPDLAVGLVYVGGGLLVVWRRPNPGWGWLLAGVGLTWFIGNLRGIPVAPLAAIAELLLFAHRGILAHAILTFPTGRPRSRASVAAVVTAYLVWSIAPIAAVPIVTVVAALVVAAASLLDARPTSPGGRPGSRVSVAGALGLFAICVGTATAHLLVPDGSSDRDVLLAYDVAVIVLGVWLAGSAVRLGPSIATLRDLMVEIPGTRAESVVDGLRRALGDPSLSVGYWDPGTAAYLDATGVPVIAPVATAGHSVAAVRLDQEPPVLVLYDPAAADSSALLDAVETTVRLGTEHARLNRDVLDQLAELRASRRRLVQAGDAERGRLRRRFDAGIAPRAERLAGTLRDAVARVDGQVDARIAERLERASTLLDEAAADLERLAQGLYPRRLGELGLAAAVRQLASESPIPVKLSIESPLVREDVAAAAYFVCAEALANAVKHAAARHASVRLWRKAGDLVVEVADDGIGGASLERGSGLRGLADRVEALGGSLAVSGEPGGSVVTARIPLGDAG
jgi:signal transduction histidine kinase